MIRNMTSKRMRFKLSPEGREFLDSSYYVLKHPLKIRFIQLWHTVSPTWHRLFEVWLTLLEKSLSGG